jgi:hypothetical protein
MYSASHLRQKNQRKAQQTVSTSEIIFEAVTISLYTHIWVAAFFEKLDRGGHIILCTASNSKGVPMSMYSGMLRQNRSSLHLWQPYECRLCSIPGLSQPRSCLKAMDSRTEYLEVSGAGRIVFTYVCVGVNDQQ